MEGGDWWQLQNVDKFVGRGKAVVGANSADRERECERRLNKW